LPALTRRGERHHAVIRAEELSHDTRERKGEAPLSEIEEESPPAATPKENRAVAGLVVYRASGVF